MNQARRKTVVIAAALSYALASCRGLQRPSGLSFPPTNLGQLRKADYLAKLGNWEAADPLYVDLERRFHQQRDARNELYAHVSRYGLEEESSDLQKIAQELQTTLQLPLVQNDLQLKQRCLEIKAHIDLNLDGVSARSPLEELGRVAEKRGDLDAVSRASGELGIVSFLEGNPKEARNRVFGALGKAMASGDKGSQIRLLSMIGQGLAESHKPKAALWPLNRALAIARSTPDTGFPVQATSGKTSALTQLGRYSESRGTIDAALSYARQHRSVGFEVDILAQSGHLAAAQSRLTDAISDFERAATLARQIRFNRGLAEVNAQLAVLYQRVGNLHQAVAAEQASIEADLKVGEVYVLPHHLALKAGFQKSLGLDQEANATYETAERIIGTMLRNSPTAGIKRSVIGAMSEVYLGHFRLAVANHKLSDAYRIIEEARGRVAADRLRSPEQERRSPPEIAAAERNLALLQVQLLDTENTVRRGRISEAITELEERTPFEELSTSAHAGGQPLRNVELSLQPDEALLEYVLDEPTSYCLVIHRDSIQVVQLKGQKAIAGLVSREMTAIRGKSAATAEGRALYAAVVQPLEDLIGRSKLIVVPDGELNKFPFGAAVGADNHYLLQTHIIDYVPSGTVLALIRKTPANEARELLAVGDVAYGLEARSDQRWPIFRGLDSLRRRSLLPLPATQDEVRSVAASLSGLNKVILSGQMATESNFKRAVAKGTQVVHLAIHAFADTDHPDRAGLVFARDDQAEDGILQVREIRQLPLQGTSLVTLSACDTSAGQVEGEEGVSNIVSAFLYGGSRSTISTYWAIEDSSTTELMKVFYSELASGTTKSDALRNAQLELLRRGDETKPPYFWAAFSLMGDGSGKIEGAVKR